MKKYNSFLFDADGTILDTTDLIVHCFRTTINHFKKPAISDDEIKKYIGLPFLSQCEKYFGNISEEEAILIRNFHRNYQLSVFEKYIKLLPGTFSLFKFLKSKGCNIVIVTSRARSTLDIYLKHFELTSLIDFTVTPDDIQKPKPDPQSCFHALDMLKEKASNALFIGDAVFDELCAYRAKIDFALVQWTHQPRSLFQHVTYEIDSFDHFKQELELWI